MANETLVSILVKTDVTRYLEFKSVDGSYVQNSGKIYKVPSTSSEAVTSSLMGILEKRRCAKLLEFVGGVEANDSSTWGTGKDKKDLIKLTAAQLFEAFGLSNETIDFVGHAMALRANDEYLEQPALETVQRIKMYGESVLRYGNSPYIYPLYGIGEMPQGFARLSAIYGGTYMLNKPVEEIVYDEAGVVVGVKSEGQVAKCKFVIGDPSYFPTKVKKTGQVARLIAILHHPIANTNNAESCQIIIPQKELKRKNDIYISCVSFAHNVAPKGKYIALVSTIVETSNPLLEIAPAIKLLHPLNEKEETFFSVTDIMEPKEDGTKDKIFISKTFDSETFFSSGSDDILDIYRRVTGKDLDLTPPKKEESKEEEKH